MLRITRRTLALAILALPLGAHAAHTITPTTSPQSATVPAPHLGASEIVREVDAYYTQALSFKATFKQRYVAPAYDRTKDSGGSVIFEKPGKMSWRYAGRGNRVVSDGQLLNIYDRATNALYVQDLSKSQYPAALSFLGGPGQLLKSFRLRQVDAVQMKFPGGYVLEGVPLQPTTAYQRVFFYVDAQTFQVGRVLMVDKDGNRNRFDFSAVALNGSVPPGEFSFKPPANTSVIRANPAPGSPPAGVPAPGPSTPSAAPLSPLSE